VTHIKKFSIFNLCRGQPSSGPQPNSGPRPTGWEPLI